MYARNPILSYGGASGVWQRNLPRSGIFKKNGAPPVLKEQLRSWISVC